MKKILFAALTAVVAIGIAVPVALGATPAGAAGSDGRRERSSRASTAHTRWRPYGVCKVTKYGVATLDNETNDVPGPWTRSISTRACM